MIVIINKDIVNIQQALNKLHVALILPWSKNDEPCEHHTIWAQTRLRLVVKYLVDEAFIPPKTEVPMDIYVECFTTDK